MIKRGLILLSLLPLLTLAASASAQGYFEFAGPAQPTRDRVTPRFGIRYNAQGFDDPAGPSLKQIKKMKKKHVPDSIIDEIMAFPGSPEAIAKWIDDAYGEVRQQFMACGGSLANRASRVTPGNLRVTIMPSAFYEPYYRVDVAGVYYPSSREIKVLNIYYHWSGANVGWLRHARDLLKWEMGNFFGVESKILPEPRPTGWPCNAPPLK